MLPVPSSTPSAYALWASRAEAVQAPGAVSSLRGEAGGVRLVVSGVGRGEVRVLARGERPGEAVVFRVQVAAWGAFVEALRAGGVGGLVEGGVSVEGVRVE